MSDPQRPGLLPYIGYCYGAVLGIEYDDWVRHDLAGKGARRRNLVRVTIPALVVIAPLWLIPATVGMHLAMSALLFLPFIYFAHALDKVWRTHRLRQHGLDPDLVDEVERQRDADIREDYRRRHGHSQD
jgi:hypothetical protein